MRFDLGALSEPSPLQQIPLDVIDEDPEQPRKEFDPISLGELAETIRERGVLQPVSLRRHATQPSRYVLNFGARRLRASRLASRTSIPAFIDELATTYDQVVENEQREGLTPLELALFVERQLKGGQSQAEIARRLGKSRPYVTYATALIDAPDWLLALYREGRCRGLRELHELRQLHDRSPSAALQLEASDGAITRQRIANSATTATNLSSLNRDAEVGQSADSREAGSALPSIRVDDAPKLSSSSASAACSHSEPAKACLLLADLDGDTVEVIVDDVPLEAGNVFVRASHTNERFLAPASKVRLIRIERLVR